MNADAGAVTRGQARYGLAILTLINLLNYLDRYIAAGMMPRIMEAFRIDKAAAGWLGSVFIIVYMLFAPAAGVLGDRFPRRFVLAGGVFLWSLATVGGGGGGARGPPRPPPAPPPPPPPAPLPPS
jgi:MFS family permease